MTGFFAILDDIAALMDDVSLMTKVAAKKTAGVLGDDLAVGAKKASDFHASRELPVLWAITKGSLLNKLIILPFAFLMTAFVPQLITPVLLMGGIYLSYEGVEKLIGAIFHRHKDKKEVAAKVLTKEELVAAEKAKIKSTVLTDFILSIEIIMLTLGTVKEEELVTQIIVVTIIAIAATIGVYGLVALMVRMDDMGYGLIERSKRKGKFFKNLLSISGRGLVWTLPKLIQLLAVVGTLAMLLVGGGMFVHNVEKIHDFFHNIPMVVSELIMGIIVGLITFLIVEAVKKGISFFKK